MVTVVHRLWHVNQGGWRTGGRAGLSKSAARLSVRGWMRFGGAAPQLAPSCQVQFFGLGLIWSRVKGELDRLGINSLQKACFGFCEQIKLSRMSRIVCCVFERTSALDGRSEQMRKVPQIPSVLVRACQPQRILQVIKKLKKLLLSKVLKLHF